MNRIQEIIRLESEAVLPEGEASRRRWLAAHLMWEEVQTGKSRNELAEEISKSRKHVQWMVKAWEVVGQHIPTGGDLPPFNQVYHSPEVRGESVAKDDTDQNKPKRGKPRKDHSQGTPVGDKEPEKSWAQIIAEAAEMLDRFPAFWEMMSEEELTGLNAARATLLRVLRSQAKRVRSERGA